MPLKIIRTSNQPSSMSPGVSPSLSPERSSDLSPEAVPGSASGARVNWGGIFCGSFMTMAVGLGFVLLGNALRISLLDLVDPTSTSALAASAWVYTCVTMVIAFFSGGLVCSRISNIRSRETGILYGIMSWAVSGVLMIFFGTFRSLIFGELLLGRGPAGANWLMVSVAALGGIFSMLGGAYGSIRLFRTAEPETTSSAPMPEVGRRSA